MHVQYLCNNHRLRTYLLQKTVIMSSVFDKIPLHPPIDAVEVFEKCALDNAAEKVDLSFGAYFAETSHLWVSPLVKKVEKIITEDRTLTYTYLPAFGSEGYTREATKLLLGEKNEIQAFGVQTLGGSGALAVGFSFLTTASKCEVVYSSDPGWENYDRLCLGNGFQDVRKYRYWDAKNKCLDFEGMYEDLSNAPKYAVIVLQACAHNPTGCDPTKEQWMRISKVMKEKKLFPFFDCAYMGYATGCLEEDTWPIRYFVNEGHELFCAQSFSKNLAIYGLRTGNLVVVPKNEEKVAAMKSHFVWLIRTKYCHPPCHGERIVTKILSTPEYVDEWKRCIRARYERLVDSRKKFRTLLEVKTQPGIWNFVTEQKGFFAFPGLSKKAVEILIQKYHVYMPESGRINMPSLNDRNLEYFAHALTKTLEELDAEAFCVP